MVQFDKVLTSIQKSVDKMSVELTDIKTSTTKLFKLEEKESKERTQQKKSEAVEKLRKSADDNKKNKKSEGGDLSRLEGLLKTIAKNTSESKSSDSGGSKGGLDWLGSIKSLLPGKQIGGFAGKALATGGGVGPYKVPGVATGDKHPMMLPTGSFVLNRKASQFLQSGGIAGVPTAPFGLQEGGMTPVIAESKELVFPPSAYTPFLQALNSSFPRFQSGGLVSHDHTGEGYNPNSAKDRLGRPVVFSKGAAEAFTKMMAKGGVNPKDVESSKRSPAHNKKVNGSATSNHLTGNAVDIHGPSKAWMKQNGSEYGWKWLDYDGHDGHFDFIKGMSGGDKPPKEGKEDGVKGNKSDQKSSDDKGPLSFLKNIIGGVGNIFKKISNVSGLIDTMAMLSNPFLFLQNFGGMDLGALPANAAMTDPTTKSPASGGTSGGTSDASRRRRNRRSSSGSASSGGGSTGSSVFDLITSGEGGLNSINQGTAGDTPGGAKSIFGKNLTDMTVAEIQQAQQEGKVFAVGKYQIIPSTMSEFVNNTNLDTTRKFDNSTQELFKDYVINQKRPAVGAYLNGDGSIEEAAQALAREFASVGLQYEEAGRPRGSSRYSGTGGNAASITPEEMLSALKKDKKGFQKGGNIKGLSPVVVESGETIFAPGTFGPEIPMMNASIPRFANGGMVNNDTFINDRFKSANELHRTSQIESSAAPIIVPMPMGGGGGGGGSAPETPIPSLSNGPSSPLAQSLLMQSYSLMRSIG